MKHLKYLGIGLIVLGALSLISLLILAIGFSAVIIIALAWKPLLLLAGAVLAYYVGKGVYNLEKTRKEYKEDK